MSGDMFEAFTVSVAMSPPASCAGASVMSSFGTGVVSAVAARVDAKANGSSSRPSIESDFERTT